MPHSDKKISRDITNLAFEVAKNGKGVDVMFKGQHICVDRKYINDLRDREDLHLAKNSKNAKKSKVVNLEDRGNIIVSLKDKVKSSFESLTNVTVTPSLMNFMMKEIETYLTSRREPPKVSTFTPRLLCYMDNHFVKFVDGITLNLLGSSLSSSGSAADRESLSKIEAEFVKTFAKNKVSASTVMNALINQYANIIRPSSRSGPHKSHIPIDDRLKALLDAPMDSTLGKESFADKYLSNNQEKSKISKVAMFRKENPQKSVRDYLMASSSPEEKKIIDQGYIMGKHVMALVSAHLIPEHCFTDTDKLKSLSMAKTTDDKFGNSNVLLSIALQSLLSATTKDDEPVRAAPARSPSKTPRRTPSRSMSRSRARR